MAREHETVIYTDGGVGPAGVGAAAAIAISGVARQKVVAYLGAVSIHESEIFAGLLGMSLLPGPQPSRIVWCCDSTACEATARGSDISPLSVILRSAVAGASFEIVSPAQSPNPKLHRSCHRDCVWAYERYLHLCEGPIGLLGRRAPSDAWLYLDLHAEWRNITLDALQAGVARARAGGGETRPR